MGVSQLANHNIRFFSFLSKLYKFSKEQMDVKFLSRCQSSGVECKYCLSYPYLHSISMPVAFLP